MLTYEDAIAMVEKALSSAPDLPAGDSLALQLHHTREHPFGWVFFYTSRLYLETGDMQYALAGNAPFIVDRHSGELVITGAAHAVEHYIAEYAAKAVRAAPTSSPGASPP